MLRRLGRQRHTEDSAIKRAEVKRVSKKRGLVRKEGGKGDKWLRGPGPCFPSESRDPRPETAFPRSFQVAGGRRAFLSIPSPKSDPEHPNNPGYKNTTSTKMRKLNPHRVDWPSLARDGSVVTSSQHHRANTRSLHQRDGSSHPSSHPGTSTASQQQSSIETPLSLTGASSPPPSRLRSPSIMSPPPTVFPALAATYKT